MLLRWLEKTLVCLYAREFDNIWKSIWWSTFNSTSCRYSLLFLTIWQVNCEFYCVVINELKTKLGIYFMSLRWRDPMRTKSRAESDAFICTTKISTNQKQKEVIVSVLSKNLSLFNTPVTTNQTLASHSYEHSTTSDGHEAAAWPASTGPPRTPSCFSRPTTTATTRPTTPTVCASYGTPSLRRQRRKISSTVSRPSWVPLLRGTEMALWRFWFFHLDAKALLQLHD